LAFAGLVATASAQITITVNGTMTDLDPDHNFTASQSIVLNFTLNNSGSPGGTAESGNYYHWVEESSGAEAVYQDSTGNAFSDTWNRSATPASYLTVYESGQLFLQISTSLVSDPMGISVNGRAVYSIVATVVLSDFSPSVG
jgi:hypothetical protein